MDAIHQLREVAANLRRLAASEANPAGKAALIDLADRCEETADHLQGNGSLGRR